MDNNIVGKPLNRIDGRLKVMGQARYSADYDFPRLAHAVCIESTIAAGRITDVDTREAEAAPGVIAVITHLNAQKLNPFPEANAHQGKPEDKQKGGQGSSGNKQGGSQGKPEDKQRGGQGQPGQKLLPLQSDRVYYSGQHIGIVIAETLDQATYAVSLVRFRYATEPPITEMEHHLHQAFVAPQQSGREPINTRRGDPDGALAMAEVKINQTYRTPVENHSPMELSATVAAWDGDKLTLYDATQGVVGAADVTSKVLGIPQENVRVISYYLGGGFGCKGGVWPHTIMAAMAAKRVGRPVKLVLTRPQMFTQVGYRAQTLQHVQLGAERDGTLVAMIHNGTNITSPYDEFTERVGTATPLLYACRNVEVKHKLVRINKGTPTFMRAPGEASGVYALESALDELAYAVKLDPIELRLRNYATDDPHSKLPWSSKSLRECYLAGAQKFGWSRRDMQPGSLRDGDTLVGWGMATAVYPANRGQAKVKVQIFPDGRARALSATQDIGTGTYTVMTQVAAENLGIPVERVHFELGDTAMPEAPVSGGSQTAASVGSAVKAAAIAARQKAIQLAVADANSPLHGENPDNIISANGSLISRTDPGKTDTFADLVKRSGMELIEAMGSAQPGDEKKQYSMYAFGAQFAEVHVRPDSGETRVTRFVGAFAAGKILNAKTARSQAIGGIVFGIGMALTEQTIMDVHSGRLVNADLAEYHVPVNADVPPIDIVLVDEVDEHINPVGVKGIGEIGIVGAPAAIANAVYHATGRRIRDLPITPDKLLI